MIRMIKICLVLSAVAAASLLCSIDAMAKLQAQTLIKGQAATIQTEYEIGDAAIASQGICDYLIGQDRRSIFLNARAGGETMMTLWDIKGAQRDEFAIRVVTSSLKDAVDQAKGQFGDLKGVDIEVRDGKVEIGGRVVDPEDYKQIESYSRATPKMRSRVVLDDDIIEQVAGAIRRAIGLPGIEVMGVRGRIVLGGNAYSGGDAKKAIEIAKLYSPDVLDLIEIKDTGRVVGRGRMIELEFHMMEIKREALRGFGIHWAPGSFPKGDGGTASTGSGAGFLSSIGDMGRSIIGFVFNLAPKLKLTRQRGDGRVLENPTMIVKSGEKSTLFSGTEVPYYASNEVQFKKVGVELSAEPIEIDNGVDIKLTAQLSSPSPDVRGGIEQHNVATTAICKFGESIIIGNVVRNTDVKMYNRPPDGVDTSSALFSLALSKDFQSNRSEFVIFVTPRLVEGSAKGDDRLQGYSAMESRMISDRSAKEYRVYMAKRSKVQGDGNNLEIKKRTQHRRWR